ARNHSRDARSTLRGDIDDIEAGQSRYDGEGHADSDLLTQPRQRDVAEFMPWTGAIEARSFIKARVDLGDPSHEQHRAKAEQHPGADNTDCGQRPDEVSEPTASPV